MKQLFVCTGASQNHARSLHQLLASLARWDWPTSHIVVWDLGLEPPERQQLPADVTQLRFPFEEYPPWMNIDHEHRGHYAWKPVVILKTCEFLAAEHQNDDVHMLWIDAGCKVNGPMDAWLDILASHSGVWSPTSSGTLTQWTHPTTLKHFGLSAHDPYLNASGGVVALRIANRSARILIRHWAHLCTDKSIVAPPGSSRANHRQDQSVLTCLLKITRPVPLLPHLLLHQDCDPT